MSKSKVKVYAAGEVERLGDAPFAALRGGENRGEVASAPVARETPVHGVARTRKGGWPLRVEKRGGGKVVTVLSGVSGDAAAMLRELKTLCGAGGTQREQEIEIQGDHRERIARWLDANAPSKR